jgi:hypothetical protein
LQSDVINNNPSESVQPDEEVKNSPLKQQSQSSMSPERRNLRPRKVENYQAMLQGDNETAPRVIDQEE